MDILSNFSERLSELLFDARINAQKLGEKTGIGYTTVNHYINKRYLPTLENAVKIADFFKVTCDYLLGLTQSSDASTFKACPPFGDSFLKVCKQKGVSRYKIHGDLKIAESAMRYWVQGKTVPSIESVIKIAAYLNCSVDYLLGREN